MKLACADFLQCDPDFTPYASNHPDKARRRKASDWFRKAVEYACEAGSKHVTGLPDMKFSDVESPHLRHHVFHRSPHRFDHSHPG